VSWWYNSSYCNDGRSSLSLPSLFEARTSVWPSCLLSLHPPPQPPAHRIRVRACVPYN
jgi:hypothetical protein